MFAEEDFLEHNFGNTFLDWAQKTPAFFPNIKNWEKPDLQFCFKTAIKKEYDAFFAIIFSFTFLEVISNFYKCKKCGNRTFMNRNLKGGVK